MPEISCTWSLPCSPDGRKIHLAVLESHGHAYLRSPDRLHRRHPADALLDGGDPRLPSSAQLRPRLVLSLPGPVSGLRRLAPRPQRAALLLATASATHHLRIDHPWLGPERFPNPLVSPSPGI